ncbi:UDP-N-acetylmuramyl-tripeptide synthetase [Candidatus Parcubacteria bacterium]|nr:UDP-N-acetylmuramyl-tripeptide synthetase [Candidatus Parcubacteria bacterium]
MRLSFFQKAMVDDLLSRIKRFIPKKLFDAMAPAYHYSLALAGALVFGFPSKRLTVIAVTGTKGKSSTTEMINAIFEAAGHRTVLLNTIRWKIADNSTPNTRKMTVPGRFFIQQMLRAGLSAGCDTAILELSSEAAKQYRHKFVYLDALVFTNLTPEHIESHGSFEAYRKAKLSLTETLCRRLKKRSVIVANADDPESAHFLKCGALEQVPFSLRDGDPYKIEAGGVTFNFDGVEIKSVLRGEFNLRNLLGAAACAKTFGISAAAIKEGLEKLSIIKGRVEFVKLDGNTDQNFDVVVDYAHTADSLKELYKAFENQRKICVLGNTGGGRDRWKRPEMAGVADAYCDEIILTNEDPYDENPDKIIEDMLPGFKTKEPTIIMDRRDAIAEAIKRAKGGDAVLITGKGTDPYIMLANGKKLSWSDYEVAKEELKKVLTGNA